MLRLVEDHLKNNLEVPDHAVPQLANQFANGLGFQLRSMPIAIRIDRQIFESHPGLRTIQRGNVEQQLQENLTALTPRIKKLAPPRLIEANASMSAAFAMFWAGLWNEPAVALPFIAAGYQQAGNDMLALTETIPDDPNLDRQLVDAWMNRLGLQNWFETRMR